MWGKAKKEDKLAAARKRAAAKSMKGAKKPDPRIAKLKKEKGLGKKNEDDVKPTHFDITVFNKSFKRYVACHGELRS